MRVAHLLPRQRGNVAVDNIHVRQRPAVDVPHGSPVEGPAGVLRQVDHRLPAVQPLVQERCDRAPVHGIAGGADHRVKIRVLAMGSTSVKVHQRPPMDRAYEGDSTRLPAESFGLTPVVPPKRNRTAPWDYDREGVQGVEHGRTRLQPHEALPQDRHPLRQDRRDLPR